MMEGPISNTLCVVMAGLVPAIHAAPLALALEGFARLNRVAGRDKPGHDEIRGQAALASFAFSSAKAKSSQWVSAATSLVSTVAPHQMRRPGGASRYDPMS